ncbi:MAG: SpaA isopeptide-forming pilin-related protein [Lachnospiraceae bacterium]
MYRKKVVKLGPTGSNGYASSVKFEYNDAYKGIYYMKETKAPVGYKLSTEVKKIDVSNAVKDDKIPYVTFYNEPYDVNIEVIKVDSKTNETT